MHSMDLYKLSVVQGMVYGITKYEYVGKCITVLQKLWNGIQMNHTYTNEWYTCTFSTCFNTAFGKWNEKKKTNGGIGTKTTNSTETIDH